MNNFIQLYECIYFFVYKLRIQTIIWVLSYKHMSIYTYKSIYTNNRLHFITICLCSFLDIHLYSNNLSTIAMIYSLILLEKLPACFSCNINFNLSQISLGSDVKKFFEIPEAMIAGDLSNFIRVRSQDLLPWALISNAFLLQNHTLIFYLIH